MYSSNISVFRNLIYKKVSSLSNLQIYASIFYNSYVIYAAGYIMNSYVLIGRVFVVLLCELMIKCTQSDSWRPMASNYT